jgi:ABC-type molybdenum transport system ATPase subunit/photorepair protein PhrA
LRSGKSTLLKLIVGELQAFSGGIRKVRNLRISRYHQHLEEQLDLNLNSIEFMVKKFPPKIIDEVSASGHSGYFFEFFIWEFLFMERLVRMHQVGERPYILLNNTCAACWDVSA